MHDVTWSHCVICCQASTDEKSVLTKPHSKPQTMKVTKEPDSARWSLFSDLKWKFNANIHENRSLGELFEALQFGMTAQGHVGGFHETCRVIRFRIAFVNTIDRHRECLTRSDRQLPMIDFTFPRLSSRIPHTIDVNRGDERRSAAKNRLKYARAWTARSIVHTKLFVYSSREMSPFAAAANNTRHHVFVIHSRVNCAASSSRKQLIKSVTRLTKAIIPGRLFNHRFCVLCQIAMWTFSSSAHLSLSLPALEFTLSS